MTSSPDPLAPPLRCGLYRAGHEVHIVQAIRAGNDDEVQPGTASVDAAGWISITLDSGSVMRRWTHDPGRLADLWETSEAACSSGPRASSVSRTATAPTTSRSGKTQRPAHRRTRTSPTSHGVSS